LEGKDKPLTRLPAFFENDNSGPTQHKAVKYQNKAASAPYFPLKNVRKWSKLVLGDDFGKDWAKADKKEPAGGTSLAWMLLDWWLGVQYAKWVKWGKAGDCGRAETRPAPAIPIMLRKEFFACR